jgi:LDH2 family malate/lactate/ureidoglycolate dehydrogenase
MSPLNGIKKNILKTLVNAGFSTFVSSLTADILLKAETYKKVNHGTALIPAIINNLNSFKIRSDLLLNKEILPNGIVTINCNNSLGYAAASVSCRYAINIAKTKGLSCVVLKNIDHIGALGIYTKLAAERGCLSFICALGKPRVPLTNSIKPLFGTTPISVGIPTESIPIIIDTSLSKLTVNEVIKLSNVNSCLLDNVAIDENGSKTTSPKAALDGALLPIGDYKGAAIVFALHVLIHSIALTNAEDHPVLIVMQSVESMPLFKKYSSTLYSIVESMAKGHPDFRMPGSSFNV